MTKQPVFKPFPLFAGCHAQTIVGLFLTFNRRLPSLKRTVYLLDGDKLVMEVSIPKGWKETDQTVVMVHGLCGSHQSTYNIRIAKKLYQKGIRSIRINLRGCGSGRGKSKKMYHSNSSEDIWKALQEIKRDTPNSPLTVVGFSLGGNIILKLAGERGEEAVRYIDKLIAVNPPIDLQASVKLLSANKVYERYFFHALREEALYRHEVFEDLPPIDIPVDMTLIEFDEFYIAPQSGHESARDYYHACSAGRLIHNIVVPSYLLFSKDDPIVSSKVVIKAGLPKHVEILVTEQGGHLGYLGVPGQEGGFHWMDSVVLRWIGEGRE